MESQICRKMKNAARTLLLADDTHTRGFIKENLDEALSILLLCKLELDNAETK